MITYIFVKLFSLVFVGSTREILIIETKQWIGKNIKNIICNKIIKGDRYLTEDKLISIVSMQERNKEISDIDKSIIRMKTVLANCEEKVVEEVKDFSKINKEDVGIKVKDNIYKASNNISILNNKIKEERLKKVENKLLNYKPETKDVSNEINVIHKLQTSKNSNYLISKFFMVDGGTSVDKNIFNVGKLLKVNNKITKNSKKPQILIYHTHGTETYIDSSKKETDTVVGVGDYLTQLLEEQYGFKVLHVRKKFDVINNKWNRNAYDTALAYIKEVLRKNPSIEVIIDLHRDSGKQKIVTKMDNINVAKIMYFNGVCRSNVGPRTEIPNKNLKYNIAFSLNMQMESMKMYPGFTKKIYLKGYRYNMHLAKKAMLVEVGNNKNTVLEAKYAMIPFAKILNKVLTTN